ncbi:U32 family peptidase [Microbulbifer thermotolerans]|uniref:Ubiquinone biosynthesis protein UbiV n=1 Tax=Microbulbifer thermotolerans TaxID=252514 RepID=A0A143HKS0_MICTH|nr:U32 family peptidase [Microbulbifer thermotolerans]AMX01852.1 U32 family peptidase [Microbulbifer thermotolerans]MCX2793515.1 U32 family peptidase [Microbulbifer thermotolerans]
MQLALGPVQYYWPRGDIQQFYAQMLTTPLDIIYLGEVVCGKRHQLRAADWLQLARELAALSDKQIVLSTLTLLESNADLNWVRKICDNGQLLVEANDMSAVQLLSEAGLTFVCGPAINIYNQHALAQMMSLGMVRWTVPVEMSARQLGEVLAACDRKPEVEVFAYGHMPLAYSARCFTARHLGLDKDSCGYRCIEFPAGLPLASQEEQALFLINGIQTMSAEPVNLLHHYAEMEELGVDILRLSPQWQDMARVVSAFDGARRGEPCREDLEKGVDGYWRAQPGLELIARSRG